MGNRVVKCKSLKQQRNIYLEFLTTTLTKTALASKHNISPRTLGRIINNQDMLVSTEQDVTVEQIENNTQVQITQLTDTVATLSKQLEVLSNAFEQYKQVTEANCRDTNSIVTDAINSAIQKIDIRLRKQSYPEGTHGYGSTDLKVSLLYKGKEISYDLCRT